MVACLVHFSFSVLANHDNIKSVLECSTLSISKWKHNHPSDTKDETLVGLMSEDEAEGMGWCEGVARQGWVMQGPEPESRPEATAAPTGGEVLIKKRALLWVKQQVSTLMHGEDLPEGALARKTAEVPYQLPMVARNATDCPMCERRYITHHHLMKHMGVHRGEKFPCDRCGKVLATRKMLKFHQSTCLRGKQVSCPLCAKPYWSKQGMLQHHKVAHGMDQPEMDETFSCPFLQQKFQCKKEHVGALQHLCPQSRQKRAFLLLCHWVSEGRPSLQQDEEPQSSFVGSAWLGRTESINSPTKATGCFDSFDGHLDGHLFMESVLYIVHLVFSYCLMCNFAGHLSGCSDSRCACVSPGETLYIL